MENHKTISTGGYITVVLLMINAVLLKHAFIVHEKPWFLLLTIPLLLISFFYQLRFRLSR